MAKARANVHQSMPRKSGGVGGWMEGAGAGAVLTAGFLAGVARSGFGLELIVYRDSWLLPPDQTPMAPILYKQKSGRFSRRNQASSGHFGCLQTKTLIIYPRMFVFFDESFRQSRSPHKRAFGVLAGITIAEKDIHRVSHDVFLLKLKHFGHDFATEKEIKGKELLKNRVFQHLQNGKKTASLLLAEDMLAYINAKKLYVFGCVCFEQEIQKF